MNKILLYINILITNRNIDLDDGTVGSDDVIDIVVPSIGNDNNNVIFIFSIFISIVIILFLLKEPKRKKVDS